MHKEIPASIGIFTFLIKTYKLGMTFLNWLMISCWNQISLLISMEQYQSAKDWSDICLHLQKQAGEDSSITFEEAIDILIVASRVVLSHSSNAIRDDNKELLEQGDQNKYQGKVLGYKGKKTE